MKQYDFSGLSAVFINCTLTPSPAVSHTETLAKTSMQIMQKHGVKTQLIRAVDHDIAPGVYPDMTKKGFKSDAWPEIQKKVMAADILVLCGPIWLGDNSSEMKKVIERLYAYSGELNKQGQYAYYGKVGGCLITGNEDGLKHCAMNILYSLQHLGYVIPPQADAGWIGEVGPGASFGDETDNGKRVGFDNDFTQRNTTFMTWNLMHLAHMLQQNKGIPAYGNQRSKWESGDRFDYENPEYR